MSLPAGQRRLLVLLAVVGVVALIRFGGGLFGSDSGTDLRRMLLGEARPPSALRDLEVLELRLAELDSTAAEFRPGRDPWRFAPRQRPRPVAPPPPPPPPPPPTSVAPPPPTNVAPPKPQPPPVDVVFLGSFGPATRRIAVFSDADEAIYNAGAGDTVKGKFEVFKIGYESVELTFVGFPDSPPEQLEIGG